MHTAEMVEARRARAKMTRAKSFIFDGGGGWTLN